jgi:hypothetical protein
VTAASTGEEYSKWEASELEVTFTLVTNSSIQLRINRGDKHILSIFSDIYYEEYVRKLLEEIFHPKYV